MALFVFSAIPHQLERGSESDVYLPHLLFGDFRALNRLPANAGWFLRAFVWIVRVAVKSTRPFRPYAEESKCATAWGPGGQSYAFSHILSFAYSLFCVYVLYSRYCIYSLYCFLSSYRF